MPRIADVLSAASLVTLAIATPALAQEVNLYTTREPGLIQPILDAFTEETGIAVNTVFLQDGLIERVQAEGESSPADILMTVDFGALIDLVDAGLTQPIESEVLESTVPEALRDPEGNWFALSGRARVLYVAKELGLESFTYEQLDDEEWRGRLCIRSGQHPYNTALFASYMAKYGEDATREWLEGIKANQARVAAGGDRDGARDIAAGICDIAIGNSYYVGRMASGAGGEEQLAWADAMDTILPTFENGGTHVNITGAGVAAHAPNREEAIQLIEYLVSEDAQKLYAEANFEHPINPNAELHPIVAGWGEMTVDDTPLLEVLPFRARVSELVDEINFDTFGN